MRIYLSGPMTGIPMLNAPAFAANAYNLRQKGHDVKSPPEMDHNEPGRKRTWEESLRRDLAILLDCDAVAVLDGWTASRGARLEVYVAQQLGIPVVSAKTLEPVKDYQVDVVRRCF